MKICYVERDFTAGSLYIIQQSNAVIEEYQAQGYELTLRQLYYQFIGRDLFPDEWRDPKTGTKNNDRSYKRLGSIVNDARLAGLIDWEAIIDRTRNVESLSHWSSPAQIMRSSVSSYCIDKWERQDIWPEVWVEKEALIGVVSRVCQRLDVSYFACRGYVSQSEMWSASERLREHYNNYNQQPVVFYLGDHDPSGLDMTEDVARRLELFIGSDVVDVRRIALNWAQVQQYSPPPNPAKLTDVRSKEYVRRFGDESWELDALDPATISNLIENSILSVRDDDLWKDDVRREQEEKSDLERVARNWPSVSQFVRSTAKPS